MNTYLHVLKNYAVFTGRSDRREYWVFAVYNSAFAVIVLILDNILGIAMKQTGYGPLYIIYGLALIIPGLAVAIRRLHDVGKSGWMILIALIPIVGAIWLIVLLATKGDVEENQYGTKPEALSAFPVADEIILANIIWGVLLALFYGLLPRLNHDFYHTMAFETAQKYIPLISGALVFSLAFIVKNTSKRILLIVISALVFIYDFYIVIMQYIK
jgi:uncharacterized membrane protein YhaH (DUF805 family)